MLDVSFQKNSSFRCENDREAVLSTFEKLLTHAYYLMFQLLPLLMIHWISRVKKLLRPTPPEAFVLGTFRGLVAQQGALSGSAGLDSLSAEPSAVLLESNPGSCR